MKPDTAPQALLAAIDADTMLREVQDWAAINTGTGNIAGLDRMARILADAFSTLPGFPPKVANTRNRMASTWCCACAPKRTAASC